MQRNSEAQDTLDSVLRVTPVGACVDLPSKTEPFQRSASGRLTPCLVTNPTAWHPTLGAELRQDTLDSSLTDPLGTWTFCAVQAVPFQRSASGTTLFDPLTKS